MLLPSGKLGIARRLRVEENTGTWRLCQVVCLQYRSPDHLHLLHRENKAPTDGPYLGKVNRVPALPLLDC